MRKIIITAAALFILGVIGGVERGGPLENLLLIVPALAVILAAAGKAKKTN